MEQEMKDQLQRIKIARIRLNAEIQVARSMLPDEVDTVIHYDGKQRAINQYPRYEDVINVISPH